MSKKKLLTDGSNNTKTAKNSLHTYYLSLQPASNNTLKENLCKFSTKECREQCLQFAGRQPFSNVVLSRSKKTEYFVNAKVAFIEELWSELTVLNKKGKCAVRLNLLSDVNWQEEFFKVNISYKLDKLGNIQLYDYTKDHIKLLNNTVKNYHFTLSFSGYNWRECERILKEKRGNISMVFKNTLPLQYRGYKVIDGDISDERYLDPSNVIVGLKYKKPKGVTFVSNKFVIE